MRKFYDNVNKNVHCIFREELRQQLPSNAWEELAQYNECGVCIHIINVLVQVIKDDELYGEQLDPREKNILKWAALLHDIKKRLRPVFTGRDHVHPFYSGLATLEIFRDLNVLKLNTEKE